MSSNSNNNWVEILDPQSRKIFYANTISGECCWEKPSNVQVTARDPNVEEWWELFDNNHKLPYYFNTKTGQTEWVKPAAAYVISLIALQRASGTSGFPTPVQQKSNADTAQQEQQQQQLQLQQQNNARKSPESYGQGQMPNQAPQNLSAPNRQHDISMSMPVNQSPLAASQTANSAGAGHHGRMSLDGRTAQPELSKIQGSSAALPNSLMKDIAKFQLEGFASKYFATHKRGILRKRVPVDKMVKFTKDAISLPLLTLNKNLHKEAIKIFKTVQRAMGDRAPQSKNTKSNSEDIQEILASGINFGEMRDEIFCQVCKQLTGNPGAESVYKGWELMSTLVVTFPPSKNFESYLEQFMKERFSDPDEKIQIFSKHCLTKLTRIAVKGPRGKVPTIAEIDRAKEAPFFPSVFGESLADIMDIQKEKEPQLKLPRIMTFLSQCILNLNGCQTEGIFRVPGDADQITDLRLRIEKNVYDISGINDASVPASLLKFWLRDLTDPLVPTELYDYCIKNAENPEKALAIFSKIPEHNQNVLEYLINFLQIVGEPKNQPVTRMSINNIAMVFAPNILRCPSENLQVILENTKYEQGFVRTLIQHLKTNAVASMK
ncbi:hypothetical protein MIR68_002860 [Amoeboaphelidium protococcarum]|nr:hypothetical protein MIR68_002860 [Amoeboaphelidium protococcarum]